LVPENETDGFNPSLITVLNKDGKNCHNCGGACQDGEFKKFPGYQYDFVGGDSKPAENNAASDAQLVAEITKQVMAQLGMK
jgi:L-fuculose-phosphate aldolase